MRSESKLHLLPFSFFILFPLTFAITYFVALGKGHMYPYFVYISDTGRYSPEKHVFALLLNACGLIMGFTVYVRYRQIDEYFHIHSDGKFAKLNIVGFAFGFIAAVGTVVVGNFHREGKLISIHEVGGFLAFGGGSIYAIIQAYFSLKLLPQCGTKTIAFVRMGIGCTCFGLLLTTFITAIIANLEFKGSNTSKWKPEDGGWPSHVISTVTEWISAFLIDIYFLTLVPEFKMISYEGPKFTLVMEAQDTNNDRLEIEESPQPTIQAAEVAEVAVISTIDDSTTTSFTMPLSVIINSIFA